jgi:hypothetical protein
MRINSTDGVLPQLNSLPDGDNEPGQGTGANDTEERVVTPPKETPKPKVGFLRGISLAGTPKAGEAERGGPESTISVGAFYRYIHQEMETEDNFKSFLMTAALCVCFVVISSAILGNGEIFAVQESVVNDIVEDANFAFAGAMGNKNLKDVHSVPDFWSWIRLGAMPLIMQNDPVYSERYPFESGFPEALELIEYESESGRYKIPSYGHYLRYNRLIGGVRMSQERGAEVACSDATEWFNKPCYSPVGVRGYSFELPPDEAFLPVDAQERVEWLLTSNSNEYIGRQLIDMEDGCNLMTLKNRTCLCQTCQSGPWIEESTLLVEMRLVMFNPNYGVLTRLQVVFFFSRGGRIWKRMDMQSLRTSVGLDRLGRFSAFCGVVWLALSGLILYHEGKEVVETITTYGHDGWITAIRTKYLELWNLVDWVSIIQTVVIVVFYVRVVSATSAAHGVAKAEADSSAADYNEFFDQIDASCYALSYLRIIIAIYSVVIILRCFKAFDAQPRLSLVSSTLAACVVDVFHFGVVFMFIFTMYSFAGVVLFGHRVADFASLRRSLGTCFFIVMGELEWLELQAAAGKFWAGFWLGSFYIIIVLLMFNMLLAIVFETYSTVRTEIGNNAETLFTQLYNLVRRGIQTRKGTRVNLSFIEECIRKTRGSGDEPRMLQLEHLMMDSLVVSQSDVEQMCPGLKRAQSTRLFKNATKYAETHGNPPPEDPNATPRSNTQEGSGSNHGTTPREDEEAVVITPVPPEPSLIARVASIESAMGLVLGRLDTLNASLEAARLEAMTRKLAAQSGSSRAQLHAREVSPGPWWGCEARKADSDSPETEINLNQTAVNEEEVDATRLI